MPITPYLHTWILDPGRCVYGGRPIPRSGSYRLWLEGGDVHAEMAWVDAEGAPRSGRFEMSPDGVPRPLPDGSVLVCRLDGDALVSEVLRDGVVIHGAVRSLSADGRTLTVIQRFPDGETLAVYTRA